MVVWHSYIFFCSLVDTESFLLAAIAYDRYVAICRPLLYSVIMSKRICCQLAFGAFLGGTMSSVIHTTNTFYLSFCSREINHFFCDISPLFSLSCSDTYIHDVVLVVFASLVEAICLLTVLLSYVCIIAAILKTGSSQGRRKWFFHLCFPFDCGHYLPRDPDFHLFAPQCWPFPGYWQSDLCVLYLDYTYAEPPDLQSKEQRCKKCL